MTDFHFPTNPSELEQHYTVLKKRFVNDRLLSEDDFGLLIELLNGSCRGVLDLHADFAASTSAIADSLEALTQTQQAHASQLAQLPPQLGALAERVSALEGSLNRCLQRLDDAQAAQQQRNGELQSALDGQISTLGQLRTLLAQQDAQLLAQAQRLQQLEGRLPPIVPEAVENHAAPALTAAPAEIIPPPPDGSEAAVTGTESATTSTAANVDDHTDASTESASPAVTDITAATADTAIEDTTGAIVADTASTAANVDADDSHPASTAQTDLAPASTADRALEDATASAIVTDTASTAANVDDHTDASTESASPAVTDSTAATAEPAASPASAASPLRRLIGTLATLRGGGNG